MFRYCIIRHISHKDICIVGYGRSGTGQYGGVFRNISLIDLASQVCGGMFSRYLIEKSLIESSYTGIYFSSDYGPSPTKQIGSKIGMSESLNCTYINKLCASGLKALILGSIDLIAEHSKFVMVGGMEHMTQAFYHLSKEDQKKLVKNTFTCLIEGKILTEIANDYALKRGITRETQDTFALNSLKKAKLTKTRKEVQKEIVSVHIGNEVVCEDEIRNFEDIAKTIKPIFRDGSVTSINTAPFGDSACFLVLTTRGEAEKNNYKVLASIVGIGECENAAGEFLTSHYKAIHKALQRAQLSMDQIDFFEVSETFAIVPIVTVIDLGIDEKKINVYGGDLAYGHPAGSNGLRIVTTLISALKNSNKTYGCVSIPGACGGGSALIIKNE